MTDLFRCMCYGQFVVGNCICVCGYILLIPSTAHLPSSPILLPRFFLDAFNRQNKARRLNHWAASTFSHGLYNKKSLLSPNLEDYGTAILLVFGPATRQLDVGCGPPVRFA